MCREGAPPPCPAVCKDHQGLPGRCQKQARCEGPGGALPRPQVRFLEEGDGHYRHVPGRLQRAAEAASLAPRAPRGADPPGPVPGSQEGAVAFPTGPALGTASPEQCRLTS